MPIRHGLAVWMVCLDCYQGKKKEPHHLLEDGTNHQAGPYMTLIAGGGGLGASVMRGLLRGPAWLYGRGMAIRNAYFNKWALPVWLDVPVISVGNLTVGGTGKTPMTLWLCRQMLERGLKPAVLSRGYKATPDGIADEILMLSKCCPQAVVVAHPDRAAAGHLAISEYRAQAAILDDGFQHRRVGRDLDIVLIDATLPFGYDYLLPRGLLREPVHSLRRAEAVVITRCDQCSTGALAALDQRIHDINSDLAIVHAVHKPVGFFDLQGQPLAYPTGQRLGAFAGIARPEAFIKTLKQINLMPQVVRHWPDHHHYTSADVETLCSWAAEQRIDMLVTTEKDSVKLDRLKVGWPIPVGVLRVEMELQADGQRVLCNMIDVMLENHEDSHERQEI
ncbi:MAG: tetraacyldisaccharide 4'-kinase [Phycisphaerales bacterium]|nr:tetraacyldisaccharide 4'-kinase [Phycisphaerales bacterium]